MTVEGPRLGLVGAGRWGRIYLRTLAAQPRIRLAALASGNPDSAALIPEGTALFADWRRMIAEAGLDGVIVATPPATHAEIAGAAVEAGLPVLVEKPVTLASGQAAGLRKLAAEQGIGVMVDHIHLFGPAFRRLKELARERGPVRAIKGLAGNHGPYRDDTPVLWDWGAHDVSMCLDLMGTTPDRAEAHRLEHRDVEGRLAENVRIDLAFGAVTADIVVGNMMDKTRRFEVRCEGGLLAYDDLAADKLTLDGRPIPVDNEPPLGVAVREFADMVRERRADLASLDLGIAVVEVLERCGKGLD